MMDSAIHRLNNWALVSKNLAVPRFSTRFSLFGYPGEHYSSCFKLKNLNSISIWISLTRSLPRTNLKFELWNGFFVRGAFFSLKVDIPGHWHQTVKCFRIRNSLRMMKSKICLQRWDVPNWKKKALVCLFTKEKKVEEKSLFSNKNWPF